MILDNARLVEDQNTDIVLPESTHAVSLLQMEARDSLQEVLDLLSQQEQPVLLLLPASGNTFTQPEHFLTLRSFLRERKHLPEVNPSDQTAHQVKNVVYSERVC